jgi:DNA-binding GntR family transcriptional regulator
LTYQFRVRDFWFFTVQQSTTPGGRREERVSLSEHAYHVSRDRIPKGEIAPGDPLSRRKLAAELGMSLLPVAEALQALENYGLVEAGAALGSAFPPPTRFENATKFAERWNPRQPASSCELR